MIEDQARCGAKTRARTPCKSIAMANGRCRLHGGKSLSGIASPSFKHGRYSKALPPRLRETFDALAKEGDEALELTAELAIYTSRLAELIERLDVEDSSTRTREIQKTWQNLRTLQRAATGPNKDKLAPRVALAVVEHEEAIERAVADWERWKDIDSVVDQVKSLGRYELERRVKAHQVIATEHALGLFTELATLVRANVSDPVALRNIADGMRVIIGG